MANLESTAKISYQLNIFKSPQCRSKAVALLLSILVDFCAHCGIL